MLRPRFAMRRARAPRGLSRVKDDRGVALVEFALVAPVLFLIIFAIVDFGRVMHYWIDSTHLTNQAARWAAVDSNPGNTSGQTLQQYVRAQASAAELRNGTGAVTQRLRICVTFPNGNAQDQPVRVTADFSFRFIPFLNLGTRTASASTAMRIERSPGLTNVAAGCAA